MSEGHSEVKPKRILGQRLRYILDFSLSNPPIYETIFHALPAASLLRLSYCNRFLHQAVGVYLQRHNDINQVLSRFFANPIAFRRIQAETATLISGSTVLQLFDRTFYPGSDLDLYTHYNTAETLSRWITEAEGYTFQPSLCQPNDISQAIHNRVIFGESGYDEISLDDAQTEEEREASQFHQEQYFAVGISCALTFIKQAPEGQRKVQVMIARETPMACMMNFHSTCTMNFISWHKAYCLYPLATLEHRKGLRRRKHWQPAEEELHESDRLALAKYADRGFSIVRVGQRPAEDRLYLPNVVRRVGDAHCWTIPLDCTGVTDSAPYPSWDPVEGNTFQLTAKKFQLTANFAFRVTISYRTKYHYLIADKGFMDVFAQLCTELDDSYSEPESNVPPRDYQFHLLQEAYFRGEAWRELRCIFFNGVKGRRSGYKYDVEGEDEDNLTNLYMEDSDGSNN